MKARHRAAKGTKYSYEDHYEDDDDYFSDEDDSYTASQRRGSVYFGRNWEW